MNTENKKEIKPVINWKCLVITAIIAGCYWFLPPKNKWILLILLYVPYLLIAWYDYFYICKRELGPTYLAPLYWWAKPENSKYNKLFKQWSNNTKVKAFFINSTILISLGLITPYFLNWEPKL